jgi:hypothetical protein
MKKEYFDIILKHIHNKCPIKRPDKCKYTDEYYLRNILDLLTNFVSWRSIRFSVLYKNGAFAGKEREDIKKDHHYKSIWRKHKLWCKAKVYESAYQEIKNDINMEDTNEIKLVIDATNIINKGGIECVGYGSETKKKKFTSLTIISDKKSNPIVVTTNRTKSKVIQNKFNNTCHKLKTLEHDIKGVDKALIDLPKQTKQIILLADTGYLSENKKQKLANKNIILITPYRKNQKNKNTEDEKKDLKYRYKVENCIGKVID